MTFGVVFYKVSVCDYYLVLIWIDVTIKSVLNFTTVKPAYNGHSRD